MHPAPPGPAFKVPVTYEAGERTVQLAACWVNKVHSVTDLIFLLYYNPGCFLGTVSLTLISNATFCIFIQTKPRGHDIKSRALFGFCKLKACRELGVELRTSQDSGSWVNTPCVFPWRFLHPAHSSSRTSGDRPSLSVPARALLTLLRPFVASALSFWILNYSLLLCP